MNTTLPHDTLELPPEPASIAIARKAMAEVAQEVGAPAADVELAVSEAVSNALRHGRSPVVLRAWAGDDRAVVAVSDGGDGPTDPFAGLLPAGNGSSGGLGLWLTHSSATT